MGKFIKVWWPWILYLLIWAATLLYCLNKPTSEEKRLREELAKAQQYTPLRRDTIRDTVEVITQQVVEVEKIKNVLTQEDKELLKDLSLKASEIESYQKMGTVIHDTIYLSSKTPNGEDTMLYHDAWADFELIGKRLRYSVRDSLAIAVKREYKHRFLFWKWGTKGYQVKTTNFNPHSSIRYNTFVKKKR